MMETAGERVDDEELSEAMKERGLGTPATRADTIERLVSTSYARRVAGKLVPSSKAMRLMDVLERVAARGLASPALTGEWEYALNEVENGRRSRTDVQNALVEYAKEITEKLAGFEHEHLYDGEPPLGRCPNDGGKVIESVWGYRCENNAGKDSACDFMIWKDRYGRYIDRGLAERLLTMETVGPIEGFVDRAGREMLTGTLTLRKGDERGWILDAQIGAAVPGGEGEEAPEQIVGPAFPCPAHRDCQVLETTRRWVCERVLDHRERTGPMLPKKVCQRELQPEEIAGYFGEEGRTAMLEGFTSKRGRPFTGLLVRKPTGKHGFEFPERPPRKKGGGGRGRKPRAEEEVEA
jgi:DNA topoisomerase-3